MYCDRNVNDLVLSCCFTTSFDNVTLVIKLKLYIANMAIGNSKLNVEFVLCAFLNLQTGYFLLPATSTQPSRTRVGW